jgi:hypothetical protein
LVVETTWTVTVQEPFAGIVPPDKESVPGLVPVADAVTVPVHVVEAFGTAAFRRLAG